MIDTSVTAAVMMKVCGLCGRFALVDFGLAQRMSEVESSEHQSAVTTSESQQTGHYSSSCANTKQVQAYTLRFFPFVLWDD